MSVKTLIKKTAAASLVGILCLIVGTATPAAGKDASAPFASNTPLTSSAPSASNTPLAPNVSSAPSTSSVPSAPGIPLTLGVLAHPSVATPAEKPAESATQRPDDGDQRDKDGFSTKFSAVRDWGPHWSLFNLTIVLVNLFSALGLIAHLGFTVLRKEKLEDETWERMGPPKTLSDVEKIAARYKSQAKGEESPVTPDEQSIVFRQFCTSACVGLALSGLIVFFIVEKLDTRMVMFDALSPLFVVLFVLTLFGGILALTSDRRKL